MSNVKVNVDLYEFLKETAYETGIYYNYEQKEVIAYVHIFFHDLKEFVNIIGIYLFDEGGLETKMFEDTIVIELNEIFENDDNCILDYKNCFTENDLNRYKEELEKQRGDGN